MAVGGVDPAQVAEKHRRRPAVAHNVVHGDQQPVQIHRFADQPGAEQRPGGKIEWSRRLVFQRARDLVRARLRGLVRKIGERQRDRRGGRYFLAFAVGVNRDAEGSVPVHYLLQRALHRLLG
ncbi:hypothetical protein D3C83_10310 [compost metagenome]